MPPARLDEAFNVDFFCIGVPKCRTTWLANCLDEHPQVAISRVKETDFFVRDLGVFRSHENPNYLRGWDWYRSLWDHAPQGATRGDFSINMLNNAHTAPEAVRDHFPDARFLVSLRDPVKRTYSHYWHVWGRHRHWGGVPDTFEEAMHDQTLLWRSRYAAQLKPWLRVFPKDRFRFLIDFELNREPLVQMQDTYAFLGVDRDFEPPSLRTRINSTKGRRGLLERAIGVAGRLRKAGLGDAVDAAKRFKPKRLIDKFDHRHYEYPPLAAETAAELRALLLSDIREMEGILGRGLEPWKTGKATGRRDALPRADSRLRQRYAERTRLGA